MTMRPSVQIALTLVCVCLASAPAASTAAAAPLGLDDQTTLGSGQAVTPAAAAGDDGTIAVTWDGPLGMFATTRRAGGSWRAVQNLGGTAGRTPQVAVTPQGNAVTAWADFDGVVRAAVAGRGRPFGWAADIGRARLDIAAGLRVGALADGRVLLLWADAPLPRRISARRATNPGALSYVIWTPGRGFSHARRVGETGTGPALAAARGGGATLAWLSAGRMRVATLAGGTRTPDRAHTVGLAAGRRALLARSADGVLVGAWVARGEHRLMTRELGAGASPAAALAFPAAAGPITDVQFAAGSAGRMVAGAQTAIVRGATTTWLAGGSLGAGWPAPTVLGAPARYQAIRTPAAGTLADGTPMLVWGRPDAAAPRSADLVAAGFDGASLDPDAAGVIAPGLTSYAVTGIDVVVASGATRTVVAWPAQSAPAGLAGARYSGLGVAVGER